jgi:hypothetical protein
MAWKGNPDNPAPNFRNKDNNVAEVKATVNRATQVRRDQDKFKNFTITLLDIDTAIFEYMDKVINLTVEDNGENVKVPMFYGSPERWKSIQTDGGIRDNQGKLQLPAIMYKRNTVAKNQNLATLNRHLDIQVVKKFDEKNKYDKFSLLTSASAPVAQILNVTMPDHVTLTYEFMMWTEYVEQMNSLIEKINFAAEEYWGDPKRFKFRVYINDYSNTTEVNSGKDRMVRTTFNMTVQAYLLPDSFENKKLTTTKTLTQRRVVVTSEVVSGTEMAKINKEVRENSYKKPIPYHYVNPMVEDGTELASPTFSSWNEDLSAQQVETIIQTYQSTVFYNNPVWYAAPNTPYDYGQEGWMAYDENFHYIYINGRWLRQPIAVWNADVGIQQMNATFQTYQIDLSGTLNDPNVTWHTPPTSPNDYGEEGWMAYDNEFHYIYSNGEWLRQPLNNYEI